MAVVRDHGSSGTVLNTGHGLLLTWELPPGGRVGMRKLQGLPLLPRLLRGKAAASDGMEMAADGERPHQADVAAEFRTKTSCEYQDATGRFAHNMT